MKPPGMFGAVGWYLSLEVVPVPCVPLVAPHQVGEQQG